MRVSYCRTSTTEQVAGLEAQYSLLAASGCSERVFSEQTSSVGPRPQLEAALDFVREGDVLAVTRLDRLARSTTDLLTIVNRLEEKGVALRILDFGGAAVDTQSPTGRLVVTMLAALAQFERELMLARQRDGIAKAKAEGRYRGRAPTARRQLPKLLELHSSGVAPGEISRQLKMSRASVYRLLKEAHLTAGARCPV